MKVQDPELIKKITELDLEDDFKKYLLSDLKNAETFFNDQEADEEVKKLQAKRDKHLLEVINSSDNEDLLWLLCGVLEVIERKYGLSYILCSDSGKNRPNFVYFTLFIQDKKRLYTFPVYGQKNKIDEILNAFFVVFAEVDRYIELYRSDVFKNYPDEIIEEFREKAKKVNYYLERITIC